jgi:hypothetical protein
LVSRLILDAVERATTFFGHPDEAIGGHGCLFLEALDLLLGQR